MPGAFDFYDKKRKISATGHRQRQRALLEATATGLAFERQPRSIHLAMVLTLLPKLRLKH